MSKLSCIISCPIDTYSGYGARSRDLVKAFIKEYPDWDIKILSQRWGNTRFGYLKEHNEIDLISRIVPNISSKPDVWVQVTIPNEFQPVGGFNIGFTASIETTVCHSSWIEGCNKMDLIITSSKHGADTLKQTIYEVSNNKTNQIQQELRVNKPVEILFEGLNEKIYKKLQPEEVKLDLNSIPEDFCFLTIGHWMKGKIGHDRKNIGYTVKVFLELFKNKENPPALLLKTQTATSSIPDRDRIIDKINSIRKTVKGKLPNIYLMHGDLTDQEVNELYNHPKVKSLLFLTKGEGFGRPLLEFSVTGKPIITSGWSGHLDFLHREYNYLIPGTLENVDSSAAVENILLKESKWFRLDDNAVARSIKEVYKKYKKVLTVSRKQKKYTLDNYTFDKMGEKLKSILDNYIPEFPEQVEVNLSKLSLPKLKKIS